jgi:hypothetical protein
MRAEDAWVDDLAVEIIGFAGRLSSAMCRWLLLIARLDAAGGHRRLGFHSTARWLAYACGLSQRAANDHVQAARALAEFAPLRESMDAGRISYSHLRAISRLVHPGEAVLVEELITVAEHGTVAHLEVIVRGLQTCEDNDMRGRGWVPENYVRHGWTRDARWRLSARLDPEQGALVEAAVTALAAAEGISQVDALIRIAEIALAHINDNDKTPEQGNDHLAGQTSNTAAGDATDEYRVPAENATPSRDQRRARGTRAARQARAARGRLRGDERAAVIIHLDAARIPSAGTGSAGSGSAEPIRPYARIANGPGLPDRVVRQLLCAGRIRTVISDHTGNVLNMGRSQRLVTRRQYRALMIRDHGRCTHPGCSNTQTLHAHHVLHWLDGGRTDMNNLTLLCEPHHLAHHNGEYDIHPRANGAFAFIRADGVEIPAHVNPADHIGTSVRVEAEHDAVTPTAATPHWDGRRLQRNYAISVLAQHREDDAALRSA